MGNKFARNCEGHPLPLAIFSNSDSSHTIARFPLEIRYASPRYQRTADRNLEFLKEMAIYRAGDYDCGWYIPED
jgi:hypothetical protein